MMEVRNVDNPAAAPPTPAPSPASKQSRPPPNPIDTNSVSQRLQKELMALMKFIRKLHQTVHQMHIKRLMTLVKKPVATGFNEMSGETGVSAFPEGENIFSWIGTIEGGKGTSYEGLSYKLSLRFPLDYPFKPPQVKFETPCFHPNVDQYGNICLDILQDMWSSAYDCRTILLSIQSLLGAPNTESPLNSYAATLWSNQEDYRKTVHKQYIEGVEVLES